MTKRIIKRRTFLAGAAGAAAASTLGFPYVARAQNKSLVVNSYGGRFEKFMREEIVPVFEKEAGVEITLDIGLGKGWLANLRASGPDNPPYDVLMTNEAWASIERAEGFFEPIPTSEVPNMNDLYPVARLPDDNGVIGLLQPIGLAYRTDLVSTPPTSWKDLWSNEEFHGKTGLYTITNSAGYMFLLMISQIDGGSEYETDAGIEEIKKLKPFAQIDFSGTMEVQLTRGEVIVGPLDFAAGSRLKQKGEPIETAAPEEGVFMFDQVFNVLKGSEKKELNYQWIDFMLRPDVQEKWARGFFTSPANQNAVIADDLKPLIPIHGDKMSEIIVWDWASANENRDAIIERWNKEMT